MRKIYKIGLMLMVMTLFLVGCSKGGKDAEKVGEKEAENITMIKGEKYSLDELKKLGTTDDEYRTFKDNLLEAIMDEYHKGVDVKEEYKTYKEVLDNNKIEMSKADEINLKKQLKFTGQIDAVYEKITEVTRENVISRVDDEDYMVSIVEHAVVLSGEDGLQGKVEEQLKETNTREEYDALRSQYHDDGTVSMERSEMTEDTIIPGFEEILGVKAGGTLQFGDETYRSVMKVVSKEKPTEEEVANILRNKERTGKFLDVADVLVAMTEHYEGLQFSKEAMELIREK